MSLDALRAAKKLLAAGHLRSSVSRAYYAAYCAVTTELTVRGVHFAHGWNNPGHEQIASLILHNTTLPRSTRYELNKAMRRLRVAREDADYRPGATLDRDRVLGSIHDAIDVLRMLEIDDSGSH